MRSSSFFISLFVLAACSSSEPVGVASSSDAPVDATGGESRPPPVVCEPTEPVQTPEVEREMWHAAIVRVVRFTTLDPSSRQAAIFFAHALPHALNTSRGESCRALVLIQRYGSAPCFAQSLAARAIMRCHLTALANSCGDPEMIRGARFALYQRGCGDMGDGVYQP